MAKLKGLRPSRIIKHALPNAWSPIIQLAVLNLAYMIVGVVAIEVVFMYPGLGALIVDAVLNRDVPVIQGAAMVFAAGAVLGFIAATMGGGVDQLLSLVVDVVISIPTLIASLIVLSAVGTATPTLALVIRIIYAMPVFHITRAVAMEIEVMDYVEVARVRGEGLW